MSARSVLEMGGSVDLLGVLSQGPVRGLRNWPGAMWAVRARFVEARPVLEPGKEPGEETWWTFTLTDRGRRHMNGYRGRFA